MTDPALLKRLGTLSQSLNEASDIVSKQVISLESALNRLRLGVWAWVVISTQVEYATETDGKSYQLTRVQELGYGKHKGEWALLVMEYIEEFDDPDDRYVTLLRETKREVKLDAIEKIPELLREIEKKAAETVKTASAKAAEISDLTQSLRKQAGVSDEKADVKGSGRQPK